MERNTPGPWIWMHPRGDYCSLITDYCSLITDYCSLITDYCSLITDETSEPVITVSIEADIERDNALVAALNLTASDAALIASAPDMLAELENVRAYLEARVKNQTGRDVSMVLDAVLSILDDIDQVIEKAKGGAQ